MLDPDDITTEANRENKQDYEVTDEGISLGEAPSSTITFNNTATTSSNTVRAQIQPRPTQPGAVRVAGLDGQNADVDVDSVTNTTVASDCHVDPENPVLAELVDEDEKRRRIQEKIDREVAERERERIEQEADIPEAEIVIEKKLCSTRVKIWSGVAVVLLVIFAIVLGTLLPREAPTPLSEEVLTPLESLLSSVSFDNGTALQTPLTPQNSAAIWLSINANLDTYSDAKKIQRYVLATLFYSTNGILWNDNTDWLTDFDECDWYNRDSFCENGTVAYLSLYSNNLVGTIPNELALLSNSLGKHFFDIECCVTTL